MPPKLKFQEGEKVLCFHGPLIYEAKCLKANMTKDKQTKYFIHYAGWNKNWDEWVPESRVLKHNDANVLKQKEVLRSHNQNLGNKNRKSGSLTKNQSRKSDASQKDSNSRASTPVSVPEKYPGRSGKFSSNTPTPTLEQPIEPIRKKRGRLDTANEKEDSEAKIDLKICISDELKSMLIDESELIKQRKLAVLPARINVVQILNDFVDSKKSTCNELEIQGIAEVAKGIKEYFNVTLGLRLLYKWERPQFEDIMERVKGQPSEIYGAFHLLRLFVKLGGMLAYMVLDDKSTHLLQKHFYDFLEYLHQNRTALFDFHRDYSVSTPEYYQKGETTAEKSMETRRRGRSRGKAK